MATNTTPAEALASVREYFLNLGSDRAAFRDWAAGEFDGGPESDGRYPLEDFTGNVHLVPCPAAIAKVVEAGGVPYRATFEDALEDIPIGFPFTCTEITEENPDGDERRYIRAASTPGYELTVDQPISGNALASTAAGKGAARVGYRHQLRTSVAPQTLQSKVSQLQANVEDYRQEGDTDDELLTRAVAACETDGLTLCVSEAYTLTATITCEKLRLHGDGGVINGFDGTGFLLSGQECVCTITGDLTFSGFEDSSNWKFQKTNYDTVAIALNDGSKIISGYTGPQVLFTHCRCGIKASVRGAESTRDANQRVSNFLVDGTDFEYGAGGFRIRSDFDNIHIRHATVKHLRSASRTGLAAIEVYSSGNPATTIEEDNSSVSITFCYIDDVVQLTTTGDSSPGNNYECCGIRVTGYAPRIVGNTVKNVTGVSYDCEPIYTKSRGALVAMNYIYNAGALEGAIAVKGAAPGSTGAGQNPGHENQVLDNYIIFDEYEYTHSDATYDSSGAQIHASGEVVPLVRRGIYIASPLGASSNGNTVVGANENDLYIYPGINGYGEDEGIGFTAVNNKSIGSKYRSIVTFGGGVQNVRMQFDIINPDPPAGFDFKAIAYVEAVNRGEALANLDFSGTTISMNTSNLSGQNAYLLYVSGGAQYDMNLLKINDIIFDITAPGATIFVFGSKASDTVTKVWDNFEARGWSIKRSISNTLFGWGAWRPRSYDIDIKYDHVTTDNVTKQLATAVMLDNCVAVSEFTATACRVDTPGTAAYFESKRVFWGNAGAATEIGSGIVNTISAISGVSGGVSTSGNTIRVTLNGNDGETYRWQVQHRVRQSAPVS